MDQLMQANAAATDTLQPGEFCRQMLRALDAAEGRTKKRKRDQTPDAIGLAIKRDLLQRAAEDDPTAETFGAWLLEQTLAQSASGPVHATCSAILDDYRLALVDSPFRQWLADGAPSADADQPDPTPIEFVGRRGKHRDQEANIT